MKDTVTKQDKERLNEIEKEKEERELLKTLSLTLTLQANDSLTLFWVLNLKPD